MTQGSLSRKLAVLVVDALKASGHILVAKGGTEGLIRQLDETIALGVTPILPRLTRPTFGVGHSTFADEAADEAIEELVETLGESLMDSDHVEDVFAEDRVIRRDVFRSLRDGLLNRVEEPEPELDEAPPISVRLDTLGYVAATAAKLAEEGVNRDALERAALASEAGGLAEYRPAQREAIFDAGEADPDLRLEIEEAVADELSDLVHMGLVELPGIERTIELPPNLSAEARRSLQAPLEEITKRSSGGTVVAEWGFGKTSIRLRVTPMSEADAGLIEAEVERMKAAVVALLAPMGGAPVAKPTQTAPVAATAEDAAVPNPADRTATDTPAKTKAAAKKTATKKTATKKTAKKVAAKKTTKKTS